MTPAEEGMIKKALELLGDGLNIISDVPTLRSKGILIVVLKDIIEILEEYLSSPSVAPPEQKS